MLGISLVGDWIVRKCDRLHSLAVGVVVGVAVGVVVGVAVGVAVGELSKSAIGMNPHPPRIHTDRHTYRR